MSDKNAKKRRKDSARISSVEMKSLGLLDGPGSKASATLTTGKRIPSSSASGKKITPIPTATPSHSSSRSRKKGKRDENAAEEQQRAKDEAVKQEEEELDVEEEDDDELERREEDEEEENEEEGGDEEEDEEEEDQLRDDDEEEDDDEEGEQQDDDGELQNGDDEEDENEDELDAEGEGMQDNGEVNQRPKEEKEQPPQKQRKKDRRSPAKDNKKRSKAAASSGSDAGGGKKRDRKGAAISNQQQAQENKLRQAKIFDYAARRVAPGRRYDVSFDGRVEAFTMEELQLLQSLLLSKSTLTKPQLALAVELWNAAPQPECFVFRVGHNEGTPMALKDALSMQPEDFDAVHFRMKSDNKKKGGNK